jgi:transposase-like protein
MTTESINNDSQAAGRLPEGVAGQLVAAAKAQGLALTGPGGLLTGLTKQVLETALEVEMAEHLGHDWGERSATGNVRNGSSRKTVRTDIGDVSIDVPRDRSGSFTRPSSRSTLAGWPGSTRRWSAFMPRD